MQTNTNYQYYDPTSYTNSIGSQNINQKQHNPTEFSETQIHNMTDDQIYLSNTDPTKQIKEKSNKHKTNTTLLDHNQDKLIKQYITQLNKTELIMQ